MVGTTNVNKIWSETAFPDDLSELLLENDLDIEYSEEDEFLDDDSSCDEEDSEDEIESDIFE